MNPRFFLLKRSIVCGLLAQLTLCMTCFAEDAAPERRAMMPQKHLNVFKTSCFDCHDAETQEGNLNLEEISLEISKDIPTAERWAKILNAINSGEMPPEGSEPISDEHKMAFLGDLSNQMVLARKILSDNGGVITLRRLNHREYANTIETLLGIRPDVTTLPDDQATAGFDTSGASLFFSSDQLEQYLATARETLRLALMGPLTSKSRTVRVEPEEEYTPHYRKAIALIEERAQRARAWKAQTEKPSTDFGIQDNLQAKNYIKAAKNWLPQIKDYFSRPETKHGVAMILTIKHGGPTKIKFPPLRSREGGNYEVRLRAAAYPDAPERFQYLEFTSGFGSGRSHLGWRKVTGTLEDPQIITFPFKHRPGEKLKVWVHQRTHQDRGDKDLWTTAQQENGIGIPPGVWVDWGEIVGPVPDQQATELAQQIMFEKPRGWNEKRYAREVINRFSLRAFRGEKPSLDFRKRLLKHYTSNRAKGQKVTEALIGPLSIVLSSPSFLYMVESSSDKKSSELTDRELAVRLSYFLWSAPPDEELMELSSKGKLSDPKVLAEQTSRLLQDERADQFVRGFSHQWLEMERLGMFQFHGSQYPTFDNAVRESARSEIFQTVRLMLDEKLPLKNLLKADYVVVNDVLASYYGIPDVEGHEFRKVSVSHGSLRGGLLGTAAVLAMGSDGIRSSPVERGAWVLRHLLNDPPPPAPPNVPQLSRLDGEPLGARKLQRAHQEEPQCAQCHQKIDPVGYGLENFNAAGLWRDKEKVTTGKRRRKQTIEFTIDPSGRLPNGREFHNYLDFRDAVSEYADDFARGLTESLIAYGLGRPYGFTDQDLADEILSKAKPREYDLNVFIHALVQSSAFQTK